MSQLTDPPCNNLAYSISLSFDLGRSHFFRPRLTTADANQRRRNRRSRVREKRDAAAASGGGGGGGNTDELTALKALDTMLRRYDRRSTPTNDLGE